ncbi:dynein light chain LC6, flagellar outer arm-like [Asterias rubens]|uniref:dynein light chain LC6, flagellar outer arm-like n=1 Tax=Asterias rubens TaxID=7604 RepID=UPI001455139C|nr:dynein light chain LC6, flagellar outer arm-like [Asterias rubens]
MSTNRSSNRSSMNRTTTSTSSRMFSGGSGGDSSQKEVVIKNVDMDQEIQDYATDIARASLEKFNVEKDIAAYIKKEFDKAYNPTWHCIVGKNFGSYVTHETKSFIYFYIGQTAFLLFKSG